MDVEQLLNDIDSVMDDEYADDSNSIFLKTHSVEVKQQEPRDRKPNHSLKPCNKLTLISANHQDDYCENIRCLKCDHLVMLFPGHRWADDAKYLFFRLNFPDRIKLKKKLLSEANGCCYACQCQYINLNVCTPLPVVPSDKIKCILQQWQCCGH